MNADIVEVVLTWGRSGPGCVLATKYVREGERFALGEVAGCDAVVPALTLGETRAEVIACDAAGATLLPPRGARVWVDGIPVDGEARALERGHVVDVELGDFTLRARVVDDEAFVTSFADDVRPADYGGFALSALAHAGLFAAFALFLPPLGASDDDGITRDQILTMRHLLDASAEREAEVEPQTGDAPAAPEDHGASGGGRAIGAAGHMGTERAPRDAGHWSAAGDSPRELMALSREQKIALVREFPMLSFVSSIVSDPNAPTVPWGDVLRGADRESHLGGLFGPDAADSWGQGGLAVSGPDEGGGGSTIAVGVRDVGDLSQSLDARIGSHDPGGFGCPPGAHCTGPGHGTHKVGAMLRMPREIDTNGRLPADVIQRIVRLNMGRFRACYEPALRTNPSLEGRVAVQFIIDRAGQVSIAQDGRGSDLPDMGVRQCIVKSFYALSFPPPNGGTVTVTYPIVLTPQ